MTLADLFRHRNRYSHDAGSTIVRSRSNCGGFANAYQHAKARLVDVAAVERRNGERAVRPDVEAYLSSAVH
ncbi:hypothetical protein [Paraburkholderia sp. Cpub6]|uniref:hypothetical protein n=1 Tax=Paraburkholderia sp. Cpub6 TaxID=2723094 RepID=UPI001615E951|nr:hypothetical protein [Paraburkholderia sp. Cpub6]MBB5458486.1 hypothetical protein [Paraburkholderia sp. Cpub6]